MVKDLQLRMSYLESHKGQYWEPLLFLVYINDVECELLSDGTIINLFADDTLFYRIIISSLHYIKLQRDIDTFACWVDDNDLTLNAGKCKIHGYLKIQIPSCTLSVYDVT